MNLIFWYESCARGKLSPCRLRYFCATEETRIDGNNGNWFFLSTQINITKKSPRLRNEDNNDVFSYRLLMTVETFCCLLPPLLPGEIVFLFTFLRKQTFRRKMKKKIIKNEFGSGSFAFFAHFSVICIHELNWMLELCDEQEEHEHQPSINTIKANKQDGKTWKTKRESNEKSFEFLIFNCSTNERSKKHKSFEDESFREDELLWMFLVKSQRMKNWWLPPQKHLHRKLPSLFTSTTKIPCLRCFLPTLFTSNLHCKIHLHKS